MFYGGSVDRDCVLLLDAWTDQIDDSLYGSLIGYVNCNRLQIPSKTTSILQPLDVYGFRQWKLFAKRITERINLHEIKVDIKHRLNIITMHSLIYDQLSSPKFNQMWRYSWYKSGYLDENPGITNVLENCFSYVEYNCEAEECGEISFIRCSHCEMSICFYHFFIRYHNHIDI